MTRWLYSLGLGLLAFSCVAQDLPTRDLHIVQLASRYAPPYSWYDLESNRYRGYIFFLQEKLFEDLGIPSDVRQRDYNDAHDRAYIGFQLEAGEVDVIVGSDRTKEFDALVNWVDEPLVELQVSVFAKKKAVGLFTDWGSLRGRVGVMVSQQGRESIQTVESPLNISNKGLNFKMAVNHQEAIDWLLQGKVDYWATDYFIGHGLITLLSLGNKLDSADLQLVKVPLYIGFSKKSKHQTLIPKISQQLRIMRQSGQLNHMRQRFMQDFIKTRLKTR